MRTRNFIILLLFIFLSCIACGNDPSSPPNTPPTASFTVSPASGNISTAFIFDASGSTDNEDPVTSLQVRWDWENDGIWDTGYSLTKTASCQFTSTGTKTIKMEVKDTEGLTNSTTRVAVIHTPPVASFSINPVGGTVETIFQFDASGCTDNENLSYQLEVRWDWESDNEWNTSFSTTKIATHQYSTLGIKTITMEVKDLTGLTDTTSGQLNIYEAGTMSDIDGNIYKTVKIGNQWWMAENLKVTHYKNNDTIPNVADSAAWRNLNSGAYCSYNNNANIAIDYGYLYNWYAINDSRKLAPQGWHMPTDEEYKQLEMYLGMNQSDADNFGFRGTDEAQKLKEAGTAHWDKPNTGATNESGFSLLPGGHRGAGGLDGDFVGIGENAFLWSSTAYDSYSSLSRSLYYKYAGIYRASYSKQWGFSVRCIKN